MVSDRLYITRTLPLMSYLLTFLSIASSSTSVTFQYVLSLYLITFLIIFFVVLLLYTIPYIFNMFNYHIFSYSSLFTFFPLIFFIPFFIYCFCISYHIFIHFPFVILHPFVHTRFHLSHLASILIPPLLTTLTTTSHTHSDNDASQYDFSITSIATLTPILQVLHLHSPYPHHFFHHQSPTATPHHRRVDLTYSTCSSTHTYTLTHSYPHPHYDKFTSPQTSPILLRRFHTTITYFKLLINPRHTHIRTHT